MKGSQILRFACIAALWVGLCIVLVKATPQFTLRTLFVIVASGIIVFVPLYKKYIRKDGKKQR